MSKHIYYIVNKAARNGKSQEIWQQLHMGDKKSNSTVYYTERKGHASEIARMIGEQTEEEVIVVAVGGDGTIHEIINGVAEFQHIIVAYIRAGSGNDFARGYHLPNRPQDCLALILSKQEQVRKYDAGYFENDQKKGYFVNSMGAGYDALIAEKANESRIKKWLNKFSLGTVVYAYFLIAELFRYQTKDLRLIVDGQSFVFKNTWFITICNQPFYGGGMKISPSANPQSGQLHAIIVYDVPKLKFILLFISVFWGGHTNIKNVVQMTGKDIFFEYDGEVKAHADGETIISPPYSVSIQPSKWRLLSKTAKDLEISSK